jgi:bifunctional UDP-N-acetylglucosamine pyrophosphorylase / glucosamine-1-phosphate N-acetyltransferase
MGLSIVILAAGQGKRMHSALPKVLHRLAGTPLLQHVVRTAEKLNATQPPIVIFGHQGDIVRHALADLNVTWAEQTQQLGTGHALRHALPNLPKEDRVLVLYGDVPLISTASLKNFIQTTPEKALGIMTIHLDNPSGFGRIIRDAQKQITHIIEDKDLKEDQRGITEINTGIYLFPAEFLAKSLPQLQNNNAQKEFYLTDVIPMAITENKLVHSFQPSSHEEVLGINDRSQLAHLERAHQRQLAEKFMQQGVTLLDPNRFDARGEITIGRDVIIDINVILEGRVVIGDHCTIGPNSILRNTTLGNHVEIKANSMIDEAEISTHCVIGPFARIRPGTVLAAHSHIGNFVEIKNSAIGEGSKINHLSYIGDSEIGMRVNVGAGTITCNYDGSNKHRTIIGDNAFIGSNTELVAPVTIGEGATIGAGSTITRDAPANQLTLSRSQQRNIENWQRPMKKES